MKKINAILKWCGLFAAIVAMAYFGAAHAESETVVSANVLWIYLAMPAAIALSILVFVILQNAGFRLQLVKMYGFEILALLLLMLVAVIGYGAQKYG